MKVSLIVLVCALVCASAALPVYVSQYLPDNYLKAQAASRVGGSVEWDYPSYSGYITVDEINNSNTFFWYFPAQNGDPDAPTVLWLNGGPGFSSLFGMFTEIGPFNVSADNFPELIPIEYTWNREWNMVFMDNPVGTGFSYTETQEGYSTSEDEVGNNLYSAVSQFFELFPNLQENEFYFSGESYAGKYVPSACYKIWENSGLEGAVNIPLVGITIGDGIMDPQVQTQKIADMAYYFGMFDENERQIGLAYEAAIYQNIIRGNLVVAFEYFDEYLNGDFYPYPTFYENVTGLGSYFNFLDPVYPPNPFQEYLNLGAVQNSIHVVPTDYVEYNQYVEEQLIPDWMYSIAWTLPTLLENYKVLIYSGQNDVILGPPPTEDFLRTVEWSGQLDYLKVDKTIWYLNATDSEPAGYAREVGTFTQAIIRDAGHMVPTDQPARAYDMIYRFINNLPFNEDGNNKSGVPFS